MIALRPFERTSSGSRWMSRRRWPKIAFDSRDDLEARLAKLDLAALLRRAASFVRAGKASFRRDRADNIAFVAEFLEKHIDHLPAYLPADGGSLKVAPLHRDIVECTGRMTDRTTISAAWNDLMVVIRELAADAERGSPC